MDHATASKYRIILFGDQEDTNPIPAGLKKLHEFARKRFVDRFSKTGITAEMAFYVVMLWRQTTEDGRAFFAEPDEAAAENPVVTSGPRVRLKSKEPVMTAPL